MESLVRVTTGASVPTSPETNDLHIYDATASSLTNHRNNNDTADKTDAIEGDHFKFDGTNWILEVEPGSVAIISKRLYQRRTYRRRFDGWRERKLP